MKRVAEGKPRRTRRRRERSSIQVMEEAFHLLRMAPAGVLWFYLAGAVPFACLLFHGWAEASLTHYRPADSAWLALLLALAFFWKTSFQAEFCRRLWERIHSGHTERPRGWQMFRQHAALWFFEVFSLLGVALSCFFIVPLPWALAVYQSGAVLAMTRNTGKASLRELFASSLRVSLYQWPQNFGIWIATGFLGLLLWINLLLVLAGIPAFFKTILGIESVYTTSPGALFNSTFIVGTLLTAWLILSPLVKSAFVLRCFHAESQTTGADLLARLAELRGERQDAEKRPGNSPRHSAKTAALLLCFAGLPLTMQAQKAEGLPLASAGPTGQDMNQAIRDAMSAQRYDWKHLRHEDEAGADGGEAGWADSWLTQIGDAIHERGQRLKQWIKRKIGEWTEYLRRHERDLARRERKARNIDTSGLGEVFSVLLIALVAALVLWLLYFLFAQWMSYRGRPKTADGEGEASGDIDLESEDLTADQLAEDEWLKLAREQISKGEARLAVRALFLATLAHLGERGLLKIQKFKSNRDYCRELELKARQRETLREAFAENTRLFERAWYGMHQIGEEAVARFMNNYETITSAQTP